MTIAALFRRQALMRSDVEQCPVCKGWFNPWFFDRKSRNAKERANGTAHYLGYCSHDCKVKDQSFVRVHIGIDHAVDHGLSVQELGALYAEAWNKAAKKEL